MHIKVKTLTGKEVNSFDFFVSSNLMQIASLKLPIDIDETENISYLKEQVETLSGVPPPQQRIIFSGKQLTDTDVLSEKNVTPGSTLHLVLALRGGH